VTLHVSRDDDGVCDNNEAEVGRTVSLEREKLRGVEWMQHLRRQGVESDGILGYFRGH